MPPVREAISALRAAMLSVLVASRGRVSIPRAARSFIESCLVLSAILTRIGRLLNYTPVLRAVAKTRKPRDLNSRASAWPMPELQPVIRTDLAMVVRSLIFS